MTSKLPSIDIQLAYNKLKTLDAKSRYHALKSLSHHIQKTYNRKVSTAEQMALYMEIIKQTIRLHGNRYSKLLSKITADWLEATGNSHVPILLKENGKIQSMMGVDRGIDSIVVTDSIWQHQHKTQVDWLEADQLNVMNKGEAFIFNIQPTGSYAVQIRIVDGSEPVLTAKELRYAIDASETAIISINSAEVVTTNLYELDGSDNRIVVPVASGNYKVKAYHFHIPNKLESFYLVLCQTDQAAKNHLLKVCEFSPIS